MSHGQPGPSELLRAHGLRSTPQRRAILTAFSGGSDEHLSADEVHARASRQLPDLSRGTVYAALAELTELGLLAAIGAPEPVRYETNTAEHDHFRCRLCLRTFDLGDVTATREPVAPKGYRVERVETRLEGICAECAEYDAGLRAGASAIRRTAAAPEASPRPGGACALTDSPLGTLALAATPDGLVRVAFEDHADFSGLREAAGSRRGSHGARAHLRDAAQQLRRYFADPLGPLEVAVDWRAFPEPLAGALRATRGIPLGGRRSYADLDTGQPARALGTSYGANPVPIVAPCHRVTRGVEVPRYFVGGLERRRWLAEHEQAAHSGT